MNALTSAQTSGPIQFGKYLLVDRLGKGGMAEVWKAKMLGPAGFARTLVVKRILPHLAEDPQFAQMFLSEARLSARLNHANIVQVYELGEVNGEYFLAMEYVRGADLVGTIRALLGRELTPPPGLAALAMRDVCRALGYVHTLTDETGQALKLIHRDVSPSNIMISFDGTVKLLDFGIAKALTDTGDKTQTGTLKGKFSYMAPEQVAGGSIDHRADLFAVGIVLHEALTGRRLFKAPSDLQTLAMVREANVEPPSRFNPAIPPELDRICMRALARNVDERYQTGEQMAADLESLLHQIAFGPENVRTLLQQLFPTEPSQTEATDWAKLLKARASLDSAPKLVRRRPIAMWGALALVLGFGTMAAVMGIVRKPAPNPAAHEVRPVPISVEAPRPVPPTPSKQVLVRVWSDPPGADVYLDDEQHARGVTPLNLELLRTSEEHALSVRLTGYRTHRVPLVADGDQKMHLTLVPANSPVATSSSKHTTKRTKRAVAGPTNGSDLERGDVVDPFKN